MVAAKRIISQETGRSHIFLLHWIGYNKRIKVILRIGWRPEQPGNSWIHSKPLMLTMYSEVDDRSG